MTNSPDTAPLTVTVAVAASSREACAEVAVGGAVGQLGRAGGVGSAVQAAMTSPTPHSTPIRLMRRWTRTAGARS